MTNNTLTTSSILDSMIGAYRAHVLGRPLPTPVNLDFTPGRGEIAVQPAGGLDLCTNLANLLVWAYTLTDVTAEWWHTSDGSLHVTVSGRTAGGARMRVYSGGAFTKCNGLVRLEAGDKEGVSLDELYTLTALLREATRDAEREREAA